jgi:uncharacterized protein (DUF4415 family)
MKIEFDPAKNAKNIAECGLSFEYAVDFDFETAKLWQDSAWLTRSRALSLSAIWITGCMCWCSVKQCAAFVSSAFARPTKEKEQNMDSRLPVIDDDGEVGDLSEVDTALFKPFSELPALLQYKLSGRGKQKAATKVSTTVRFDADVLSAFKATGRGWQTGMNDALKEWLREHAA